MIRLNHWADVHASRKKMPDVFASMDVLEREADGVDLQICAGDIWDSPIQNTGATGFPEFIARMRRLAVNAPLVMVQGTPTHDSDGSLDIFEQDENITVLRPGKAYFLWNDGRVMLMPSVSNKALIFGVPEPQKKWLIASGTDVTMDQALNALFMGYAAIRQQYPDLPCILVYHGQVRGARMGHGQACEHGVSIDDLALVGADYIAMGDIHIPQRIGESRGLHAYYPGAIHPVRDWGDSDYQFGFNRVEIQKEIRDVDVKSFSLFEDGSAQVEGTIRDQGFRASVSRIPFPHPVHHKVEHEAGTVMTAVSPGLRVWLELTGTKQDQAITDTSAILDNLLKLGADPKSRVTFKTTATETVRAGAISALRKLRDKFRLWAENSGRTLTESQQEKADLIEQEASGNGLILNGGHFTFDKLFLRGSKGIWKNQRKDEVTFDLTDLDSGIVGLVGENGKGKTTIMNNFHPWPEMPNFGSDPLYKHFRLKDSLREVWATDHLTGIKYRAQIKINASAKTCEYFLFQGDGQNWAPVPGIDGRLKSYEQEVNRIFGSLEMYLRTAFMMQFPTSDHPDLARATKGTKKAIMSALAGLDYFEVYKAGAKAKADALEADIEARKAKMAVMQEAAGDREELVVKATDAAVIAASIKNQLPAKLAAGQALAEEVKILEQRKADQKAIEDRMIAFINAIPRDQIAAGGMESTIANLREVIAKKTNAEVTIGQYEELSEREFQLNAEKMRILEQNGIDQRTYQDAKDIFDAVTKEFEGKIQAIEAQYQSAKIALAERNNQSMTKWSTAVQEYDRIRNQLVSSLALINQDIQRLEAELAKPFDDHCPTCKQMMPKEAFDRVWETKKSIETKLREYLAKSDEIQANINAMGDRHAAPAPEQFDESKVKAATDPLRLKLNEHLDTALDKPVLATYDANAIMMVQSQIQAIDITGARKIIEDAATAQVRIEELTKQLAEVRERIAHNQRAADELRGKLDTGLIDQLTAKTRELEAARTEYNDLTNQLARSEADVKYAQLELEKYEANAKEIEAIKRELVEKMEQLADWQLLAQACGQNGIQALELDAVCPTIASVANKLLEEYEDGRYSIRFDTTREGGKGNQIEDFLIQVIDSKDGGEQEFETLSGGECVWIRYALQAAFGIIRGMNAGTKFLTGFMDESDSALFPESRIAYFRMLESAHAQSVRKHTVCVSHSTEIQEMMTQKIEVTSL